MEKVRVSQKEFEAIYAIVKEDCTEVRMSEDFESMAKDFYYEDKLDEELMNARGYGWNCNPDKFANTYKQYMRNEYGDWLYRFSVIDDKNKVVKTVYVFDGDECIDDILNEVKEIAKNQNEELKFEILEPHVDGRDPLLNINIESETIARLTDSQGRKVCLELYGDFNAEWDGEQVDNTLPKEMVKYLKNQDTEEKLAKAHGFDDSQNSFHFGFTAYDSKENAVWFDMPEFRCNKKTGKIDFDDLKEKLTAFYKGVFVEELEKPKEGLSKLDNIEKNLPQPPTKTEKKKEAVK